METKFTEWCNIADQKSKCWKWRLHQNISIGTQPWSLYGSLFTVHCVQFPLRQCKIINLILNKVLPFLLHEPIFSCFNTFAQKSSRNASIWDNSQLGYFSTQVINNHFWYQYMLLVLFWKSEKWAVPNSAVF